MVFKTNKENVISSNLEPKINEFKICLQQWSHRKLTLMGKIVVIKNFALPKLIYPLTSLQNPSKETIKRIEQLMYAFLWDNKPDKIKRSTLIKDYNQGGLRMIDIEKSIWSLKASWIKRFLLSENKSLLKNLYEYDFKIFGGNVLFECNFNDADVIKYFKNKPFLKDILLAWFLAKCQIVNSSLCEFCNMEIETFSHLFWECTFVQQFWASLSDFLNRCDINVNIDLKTINFGIIQSNPNCNVIVKNFIIYLGKYFIFQSKHKKEIPNIQHFKSYLITRIELEKEIAMLNDKLAFFETKWRNIIDTLTENEP